MVHGNAQLMVHAGGFHTTREQLAELETPMAIGRWKPVPHYELVQAISEEASRRGIEIVREELAYQPKRDMVVGIMVLNWQNTDDFATCLAFKHSNDRTESIKLYAGVRVFACDNTSVSGDTIVLKKKHYKNLNLLQEVNLGLDTYQSGQIKLIATIDQLKNQSVKTDKGKEIIFDVFRRKIVPLKLFRPVADQWLLPTVEENMWSLHNCFTEPMKGLKPIPFMQCQSRVGQFFGLGKDAFVGNEVVVDEDEVLEAEFEKVE